MATLERPLKEGSVRTYQEKVALGFPDILASEADADLDTIYVAWNGGIGTANLQALAVTTPKLADFAVTIAKLAVGAPVVLATTAPVNPSVSLSVAGGNLLTFPAITTRGGVVIGFAIVGGCVLTSIDGQATLQWTRNDVTNILLYTFPVQATGKMPLPASAFIDVPPAGTHTYKLGASTGAAPIAVQTSPSGNQGAGYIMTFA